MFKSSNKYFLPDVKLSSLQLLILSIICLLILLILYFLSSSKQKEDYSIMVNAAETMYEAGKCLSNYRAEMNIDIDDNLDPLNTGFIGTEFSPITTTLGDLESKKLSTNPDFAALFILWFNQLGLKENDKIIIHLSGSFPALGIAAIVASELYKLEPIIFSSVGASSFGANHPLLTYWDIENYIYKEGIISHRTQFATLGGQNDNGASFWEEGLELAYRAAERNSLTITSFNTIDEMVNFKDSLVNNIPTKLFINVGGNHSAIGSLTTNMFTEHGLIVNKNLTSFGSDGVIKKVNSKNIPIIHMMNIKDIALENGIDLTLSKNYKIGSADLYYTKSKPIYFIYLSLFILILAILITSKLRKKSPNSV